MKKTTVALFVLIIVAGTTLGAGRAGRSGLSAGARYHVDHSVYEELPFDAGDMSYGLAYEYRERQALWQVAMNYAPHIGGATNDIDYVMTPQLNLIFTDNNWRGGTGILKSYIKDEVLGGDWTDVYWQFLFGFQTPVSRMKFDFQAFYVFNHWDELSEFDFGDVEFGGWLSLDF